MSNNPEHSDHEPPYFDDSLVINTRFSEIERKNAEDKQNQRNYNQKQLAFNFWLVLFTGLLFLTSIVSNILLFRYVQLTKQSADATTDSAKAATKAANAATDTLEEIRKGGSDTHALAVSAGKQADAGRSLANTTREQNDLLRYQVRAMQEGQHLQERPWLKIKHQIISPLTFNVGGRASGIPVAMMVVRDTIENIGKSVAVNVFSWEDVVPIDLDYRLTSARARQKEWCDANRRPNRGELLSGNTLFPGDPLIQQSSIGPQMPKVEDGTIHDEKSGLRGKVGFVLVGCVCYKSSFESSDIPTHQTRFLYYLGVPQQEGGFNPYVLPNGVANTLSLIEMPIGFTAD